MEDVKKEDIVIANSASESVTSHVCEGVEKIVDFESVREGMSRRESIGVMVHRLGMTAAEFNAAVRDRYPLFTDVKREPRDIGRVKIRCFLKSDIAYTDVLHAGFQEMRAMGMGRLYLANRILRAVLAGMCDSIDRTGRAGDFPPRSWMTEREAESMKAVQEECLKAVKEGGSKLLHSVKVRMGKLSTGILYSLSDNASEIRKMIRKTTVKEGISSGLNKFSDFLIEYINSYRKRVDRRLSHWIKNASKRKRKAGQYILSRVMATVRHLKDPSYGYWYRRPSDEDWDEGLRSKHRKPVIQNLRTTFRKYGLGTVEGITERVTAEGWDRMRDDWSIAELRERFKAED